VTERRFGDVGVTEAAEHVALVEIHRPPDNYFDAALVGSLAEALEDLAAGDTRAVVLASEGKHFCAGANFTAPGGSPLTTADDLYEQAVRLFRTELPIVAAVQGAAVGGGLGVALAADFRVAAPEARFAANFARLGLHHGFGITVTLPRVVGPQRAAELLYTGRRLDGEAALAIGLCDRVAPLEGLRQAALELAGEIAASAPLAVRAIRRTMRGDLADQVRVATAHERVEQQQLAATADFAEGVAASAGRRPPKFSGR